MAVTILVVMVVVAAVWELENVAVETVAIVWELENVVTETVATVGELENVAAETMTIMWDVENIAVAIVEVVMVGMVAMCNKMASVSFMFTRITSCLSLNP